MALTPVARIGVLAASAVWITVRVSGLHPGVMSAKVSATYSLTRALGPLTPTDSPNNVSSFLKHCDQLIPILHMHAPIPVIITNAFCRPWPPVNANVAPCYDPMIPLVVDVQLTAVCSGP